MRITSESLKRIIESAELGKSGDFKAFLRELTSVCAWFSAKDFSELRAFLLEEYGISSESQLKIASIDIENDIVDFVNSKAA